MNKHIQELADKAYQWALAESKEGENMCREGSDYFLALEKEKFAELLVCECMAQCTKVEEDEELSNYEGGFRDGALLCHEEIKKHFGVDE